MKVIDKLIRSLRIEDSIKQDPVTVYFENLGRSKGKVTIEYFGETYSTYWGATGCDTIEEFFVYASNDYIIDRFSDCNRTIFDSNKFFSDANEKNKDNLAKGLINQREFEDLEEKIESIRFEENFDYNFGSDGCKPIHEDFFGEIFGKHLEYMEEWWIEYETPFMVNPEYTHIDTLINIVKEALAKLDEEDDNEDEEKE